MKDQAPGETVAPKVNWESSARSYTDVGIGAVFGAGLLMFYGFGFGMLGSANASIQIATPPVTKITDDLESELTSCCQKLGLDVLPADARFGYYLCDYDTSGGRLLSSGNGKFPAGANLFEAFALAPEIPATLIAMALFIAVLWIFLLRQFATPIVFATELAKIAGILYIAVKAPDESSTVIFVLFALVYLALIIWKREKLQFAGKIISHSAKALQSNSSMFIALLGVKACYVLQAFLFVTFMIKSIEVREVDPLTCSLVEAGWIGFARTILGFVWIWSVMFYSQLRLSIIATTVGSWHFHPDAMPPLCQGFQNSLTKSFGTLSLSALILAIMERIKKTLTFKWYHHCFSCGATLPLHFLGCVLLWCLETCIKMLTKFTTILHVFTGLNFFGSAKKCFGLMSRHFEDGFITDAASTSVLQLGAYVFSFCITFTAWAWIDAEYGWSTMPEDGESAIGFYLWMVFALWNLWHPEFGIALILILSFMLEKWASGGENEYVAPICATFVGIISMLFMKYMGGIILDTIDVCFVCWAVDKDNNVDLSENEFSLLIMELPGMKKGDASQMTVGGGMGQLAGFGVNSMQQQQQMAPNMAAYGQPMQQQHGQQAPQQAYAVPPGMQVVLDANGQQVLVPINMQQQAPPAYGQQQDNKNQY